MSWNNLNYKDKLGPNVDNYTITNSCDEKYIINNYLDHIEDSNIDVLIKSTIKESNFVDRSTCIYVPDNYYDNLTYSRFINGYECNNEVKQSLILESIKEDKKHKNIYLNIGLILVSTMVGGVAILGVNKINKK